MCVHGCDDELPEILVGHPRHVFTGGVQFVRDNDVDEAGPVQRPKFLLEDIQASPSDIERIDNRSVRWITSVTTGSRGLGAVELGTSTGRTRTVTGRRARFNAPSRKTGVSPVAQYADAPFRLTRLDTCAGTFEVPSIAVNYPTFPHPVIGRAAHRATVIFTGIVADRLVERNENFSHGCAALRWGEVQQRCRVERLKRNAGERGSRRPPKEAAGVSTGNDGAVMPEAALNSYGISLPSPSRHALAPLQVAGAAEDALAFMMSPP